MNTPVNGDTAGGRAVLIVCLQSLFVHDARDYGNAPSGHAIGLIGISPPQDLCGAPSFAATDRLSPAKERKRVGARL